MKDHPRDNIRKASKWTPQPTGTNGGVAITNLAKRSTRYIFKTHKRMYHLADGMVREVVLILRSHP